MPTSHLEKNKTEFLHKLERTANQITDFLKLTPWDFGQAAYDKLKNSGEG